MKKIPALVYVSILLLIIISSQKTNDIFDIYYIPLGTCYAYAPHPSYILKRGLNIKLKSTTLNKIFEKNQKLVDATFLDPRIIIVNAKDEILIIDHNGNVNYPQLTNLETEYKIKYDNKIYSYDPRQNYKLKREVLDQVIKEIELEIDNKYPNHRDIY